jgi:cell division protein FtsB
MKEKVASIWKFGLVIIRNKYLITFCLFALWVTFLDSYNLIDRFKNLQKLNELKKEVEFFRNEIEVYNAQYKELFSDKDNLEKFAREQFLMKEENEDVFIVISD